jgi:hypothetical protein
MTLLMAIADARLPAAVPFLSEVAGEQSGRFAEEAQQGLAMIGTAAARAALWRATHRDDPFPGQLGS